MSTDLATHICAVVIGLVIALLFMNRGKKEFNEYSTVSTGAVVAAPASSSRGNNKRKNKKKKKKGGSSSGNPTDTVSEDESGEETTPRSAPPPEAFKKAPANSSSDQSAAESAAEKVAASLLADEDKKDNSAQTQSKNSAGKKKKNKKKNKGGGTNGGAKSNGSADSKENQGPAATKKEENVAAVASAVVPLQPRVVVEEEWSTIPVQKKKKRPKKVSPVRTELAESAAETASVLKETVTIDAARVGIIIGPKGETMKKIEEKAGVRLDVNAPKPEEALGGGGNQFRPVVGGRSKKKQTATVIITEGTTEAQMIAKKAVLELADRGYAALLQSESFGEASVSIHPRYLSEIVGTKGKIINAIQDELEVKLTIPKTEWNPKSVQVGNQIPSCRVGVAGDDPKNVKLAKQVIKDICNYHYHEITHPGMSHQEVFVPQEFFHCVIGARGSEIKHIRGNFKVDVYMPNAESVSENVICVGRPNDVERAITYIKTLMDRDTDLREQKYSDDHFGDDSYGW